MGEYEPNDSRKVTQDQQPTEPGKTPHWRQAEAGEAKETYEPTDSRHVTEGQQRAAGEPGEGEWRQEEAAEATELEEDERGYDAEPVAPDSES